MIRRSQKCWKTKRNSGTQVQLSAITARASFGTISFGWWKLVWPSWPEFYRYRIGNMTVPGTFNASKFYKILIAGRQNRVTPSRFTSCSWILLRSRQDTEWLDRELNKGRWQKQAHGTLRSNWNRKILHRPHARQSSGGSPDVRPLTTLGALSISTQCRGFDTCLGNVSIP